MSEGAQAPAPSPATEGNAPPSNVAQVSADLGREIAKVQSEMERSIQLAGIKNDPLAPLLRMLTTALGLQWRLHDQAVAYFRDASDRLDQQLEDTIAQGGQALDVKRAAIVQDLAPELARLTTNAVRTWKRNLTLRTALTLGGFSVALALGVGAAAYGAGWEAGRSSALSSASALAGALSQAGPAAERAFVDLVRANNLGEAWARCQKTAMADKEGRRVCTMPMWADPEGQPTGR